MEQGGSVELKALANEDIRIPYAAFMAIYETDQSISMVHSYSRSYSVWEIEEERTITDGHEGCWTLRDTADITLCCSTQWRRVNTLRLPISRLQMLLEKLFPPNLS